jgi:methylphosphotriester-DNA--protein-cysteine methyltransferase
MKQFLPCTILQPFIKSFLIIESEQGMVNRILPDTSIVMAFRLKGQVTYTENGTYHNLPSSVITGIRESSRLIDYSKNAATLLVIFHEGGAAAFFKEPLHELSGISVSLDYLIHCSRLQTIEEQLAETHSNSNRIQTVEEFLLSELKKTQADLLIQEAIQKIKFSKGDIKIKDLLTGLPISRDPFEKRFRRITGTSPKQFSGIVRLKNLINNYSGSTNLTDAAHKAGYFDQAHFIKDFRSFTGQTPHDFFKSATWW